MNIAVDFHPYDRPTVANPLMNLYRCRDGQWIACGMAVAQRFWPEFCRVMGLVELELDPRFATDTARAKNRQELIALLDRAFATQPRDYWEQIFREKGFWISVVNHISDLPTDLQVMANEYIVELDTGLKTVSSPFALEKSSVPLRTGAPALSQHTEEILERLCGSSPEDILAPKEKGAVW